MMKFNAVFATLLLSLSTAAIATPTTITFENLNNKSGTDKVSGGFNFNVGGNGASYLTNSNAANGSTTLLALGPLAGSGNVVTMTRTSGGNFSVLDFDGGELLSGRATDISYVGMLGNTIVTSGAFHLDGIIDGPNGAADFQNFIVNSGWVDSFRFTGFGNLNSNDGFALDNISVLNAETSSAAASVPEPGSLALGGLGLLGLALVRRRRA